MDEYGDESAGPRLAKVLRRYQHVSTGSRLGFVGHIDNDRPGLFARNKGMAPRSEEHTSEIQSLMRSSYAVFCLKKKKYKQMTTRNTDTTTIIQYYQKSMTS